MFPGFRQSTGLAAVSFFAFLAVTGNENATMKRLVNSASQRHLLSVCIELTQLRTVVDTGASRRACRQVLDSFRLTEQNATKVLHCCERAHRFITDLWTPPATFAAESHLRCRIPTRLRSHLLKTE